MNLFRNAFAQATTPPKSSLQTVADGTTDAFGETLFELKDFFLNIVLAIPRFFGAVVVFVLSIWFARFMTRVILARFTSRAADEINEEVLILLERTIYSIIVVLGGLAALQIMGINDIMQIVGFFGLGLGFAFKDLLATFIAGVVILTQKKFKLGDVVQVADQLGTITQIESRTTQLRTFNGTELIIPNADMLTSVVQNYTVNSFRRITFDVGVHYNDDLKKCVETARNAAAAHPAVVREPATDVIVTSFDDSAINLTVRFWVESVDNWWMIKSEIIQAVKLAFDAEGITIPFPIRTLALDSYDGPLQSFAKR